MKRIRVILGWLLAGAVVNVLVAWGIAVTVDMNLGVATTTTQIGVVKFGVPHQGGELTEVDQADLYVVYQNRRLGANDYSFQLYEIFRTWQTPAIPWQGKLQDLLRGQDDAGPTPPEFVNAGDSGLPTWVTPPTEDMGPVYATYPKSWLQVHRSCGRGWPLSALCFDVADNSNVASALAMTTSSTVPSGWMLDGMLWPNGAPRVIPLRPTWPGFVANTLIYATLLWLPLPLRRFVRRRRGLCPNCAYDLRGTDHAACPECGAEIAKVGAS